jgi:hypothetical protein
MASDKATSSKVLIVDLDNTLIKTDLLFEGLVQFIKQHPLKLPKLLQAALT